MDKKANYYDDCEICVHCCYTVTKNYLLQINASTK